MTARARLIDHLMHLSGIIVVSIGMVSATANAAPDAGNPAQQACKAGAPPRSASSDDISIRHRLTLAHRTIHYDSIVASTILCSSDGGSSAQVYSFSYIGRSSSAHRPVIFIFNGGPGASSAWLHMGLAGPRRIELGSEKAPTTVAPFQMVDNDESLLEVADLVFIDPPETGLSRVAEAKDPQAFFSVKADAELTGKFIGSWLTKHDRWNAPKFLLGESYGSIRAATVARMLAGTETGAFEATSLNGIILLGQSLDLLNGGTGDDRRYIVTLPALAATAAYHGKVSASVGDAYAMAYAFAATDYMTALFEGDDLPRGRQIEIAAKMAGLIGVSPEFILRKHIRVSAPDFASELLRDRGEALGLYDSRFVLPNRASGGDDVGDDPAMAQYGPAYAAAFRSYLQDELGVRADGYMMINFAGVNSRWTWGADGSHVPIGNYGDDLAVALNRNPRLKVFLANGLFDLVTPPAAARYESAHSAFRPGSFQLHVYESGHMPYVGPSRVPLARDLKRFILENAGSGDTAGQVLPADAR